MEWVSISAYNLETDLWAGLCFSRPAAEFLALVLNHAWSSVSRLTVESLFCFLTQSNPGWKTVYQSSKPSSFALCVCLCFEQIE